MTTTEIKPRSEAQLRRSAIIAAAKEAKLHASILLSLTGPRIVGSRCHCGYWNTDYTVTAIHDDNPMHPTISVLWDATPQRPAHETEHCTRWAARGGDRIISQPEVVQ